jgi:RHS repeat-associated protein
VSDRKIGVANASGVITSWTAQVLDAQDYFPFGMAMPGRKFSANIVYGGANAPQRYRYGFNGKENDKDAGEGIQDYGMRIYDRRLGRFLSVDPLTRIYPELTPYQFASNTPIQAIDLDGLEKVHYTLVYNNKGLPHLTQGKIEYTKSDCLFWTRNYDPIITIHYGDETYNFNLKNDVRDQFEGSYENMMRNYNAEYDVTRLVEFLIKKGAGFQSEQDIKRHVLINAFNSGAQAMAGVGAGLARSKMMSVPSPGATTTNQQATRINNGNQEAEVANTSQSVPTPGPSLKTTSGRTIYNSKWAGQLNPTAVKKGFTVPVKSNGYPDFSEHLYTGGVSPRGVTTDFNTVKITMTGSYDGDFALANAKAGFLRTPRDYTWHHTEIMRELQLILTTAHNAARHSAGVQLYKEQHGGKGY